ncbi:unnamed protein product [Miscanthus lutarioriparius]|uniref:Uncharacterized protein n=1 Tax=Miscanthus lutarioriparius TaxID=422564 RepID=A0A811SJ67_9POAL|nr:unnamed protein product [Miscanthus lutarioriparius]
MGCTTSHDAFAAAVTSSSSRARARRASASGGDPAALCRERVALIRAAADSRYALTAAHAAYFRSLAAVGDALRRFAASALAPATPESSSPVLTLPPSPAKPVAAATASASVPPSPSSSSSTVSPLSHSLSDDDLHLHDLDDTRHGGGGGGSEEASTRYHHHFMRRSSTVPTVVYEDPDAQTQYTTAEASYGYAYGDGYGHAYGNGYGHSYGPAYPYGPYGEVIAERPRRRRRGILGRRLRPRQRRPRRGNSWTRSHTSCRRMLPQRAILLGASCTGMPLQSAILLVASCRGRDQNHLLMASYRGRDRSRLLMPKAREKPVSRNDSVPSNASSKSKEERKKNTVSLKGTVSSGTDGSSTSGKKKGVAFEAEQSIRAAEGGGESHGKSIQSVASSEPFSPLHHGTRDVREAIGEVKELFDEAANCSTDVSRLLEVGKMPPRDTPRVLRYISSRVIDPLGLTVSTSSCLRKSHGMKSRASSSKANTSASSGAGRSNGIGHLSSTLEKLWFWEKKLYQEIKDEEKLRMKYEKYYRRLKSMDDRGAESSTIHSVQLSVRHLKSKISINMSTAKAFSLKIQQIRDEELYPQLVDLIQRFRRLWKAVLECHEKQLLAIQDSRIHRLKAMTKWLPEVQEEVTADGPPPFSPGRILAPPVFIISNDWFQAIEMVSKNDVLRAIDQFSKVVHEFKKSQEDEQRQKRKADHASKDYNRKCKDLEIELGLSTMENPRYSHDNRVMDLEKLRKRRDVESTRHDKTLSHAHVAASATLPIGLVPVLQQITSFFQRNQRVYMEIRIQGA